MAEKTELKVGAVRDILNQIAPKRMGAIWLMNRESDQWTEIADKRIFALSSACDKKEYNPPIRRVAPTFIGSVFHLAEKYEQMPEESQKEAQIRFERFVNSTTKANPTFLDFRNSRSFEIFEEEADYKKGQGQSTPVHDENNLDYADYELSEPLTKKYKY